MYQLMRRSVEMNQKWCDLIQCAGARAEADEGVGVNLKYCLFILLEVMGG